MIARLAVLLLILSGLVGCGTAPAPGGRSQAETPPAPPPPPLAGSSLFYDGRLECRVEVSFGRMRSHGPGDGSGGGRTGTGQGTGGVQGNGGSRGAGGGSGMGRRGGGSAAPADTGEDSEAPPLSLAALGPPVTLYLRFTNRGKDRIEFEVLDFASQFGNFAVQPDKLALEPGQWAEAEPMSSQILNTSGDVDVKISLRSAGRKETETVALLPLGPG